jgi:hypothetical protein
MCVFAAAPTRPQLSIKSVKKYGVQQNKYDAITMAAVLTARPSSRNRRAEKLAFEERLFGIPIDKGGLFHVRLKFSGVPFDVGGIGRSNEPPLLQTISPGFAEMLCRRVRSLFWCAALYIRA